MWDRLDILRSMFNFYLPLQWCKPICRLPPKVCPPKYFHAWQETIFDHPIHTSLLDDWRMPQNDDPLDHQSSHRFVLLEPILDGTSWSLQTLQAIFRAAPLKVGELNPSTFSMYYFLATQSCDAVWLKSKLCRRLNSISSIQLLNWIRNYLLYTYSVLLATACSNAIVPHALWIYCFTKSISFGTSGGFASNSASISWLYFSN